MNICIVGSNRGIGLELCRQYTNRGDKVWALCREKSSELERCAHFILEGCDVTDVNFDKIVGKGLDDASFDVLIHVAGAAAWMDLENIDFDVIEKLFSINSVGPLRSVVALKKYLKPNAVIGLMSSRMGSINDNSSGGSYAYRMSKTALNAAGKSLALDLKEEGISVAILHPGWVRTDMTNHNGLIDVDESCEGILKIMGQINLENTGQFWHTNGENLPW